METGKYKITIGGIWCWELFCSNRLDTVFYSFPIIYWSRFFLKSEANSYLSNCLFPIHFRRDEKCMKGRHSSLNWFVREKPPILKRQGIIYIPKIFRGVQNGVFFWSDQLLRFTMDPSRHTPNGAGMRVTHHESRSRT